MPSSARKILLMCVWLLVFMLVPGHAAHAARNLPPARWQELTADKAFSYKSDKEVAPPPHEYKESAIHKFFSAFFEFFSGGIGNVILWIIVIALVGFVLYSVFFSNNFLFSRNRKMSEDEELVRADEDVATTNWEALLQQATQKNDFRLAVRYSYMWLLQMLQQRELIKYRADKTNYDYYAELNETAYKQPFKQLSRQYEYAWYGEFTLSAESFHSYLGLFNNVKNQLRG